MRQPGQIHHQQRVLLWCRRTDCAGWLAQRAQEQQSRVHLDRNCQPVGLRVAAAQHQQGACRRCPVEQRFYLALTAEIFAPAFVIAQAVIRKHRPRHHKAQTVAVQAAAHPAADGQNRTLCPGLHCCAQGAELHRIAIGCDQGLHRLTAQQRGVGGDMARRQRPAQRRQQAARIGQKIEKLLPRRGGIGGDTHRRAHRRSDRAAGKAMADRLGKSRGIPRRHINRRRPYGFTHHRQIIGHHRHAHPGGLNRGIAIALEIRGEQHQPRLRQQSKLVAITDLAVQLDREIARGGEMAAQGCDIGLIDAAAKHQRQGMAVKHLRRQRQKILRALVHILGAHKSHDAPPSRLIGPVCGLQHRDAGSRQIVHRRMPGGKAQIAAIAGGPVKLPRGGDTFLGNRHHQAAARHHPAPGFGGQGRARERRLAVIPVRRLKAQQCHPRAPFLRLTKRRIVKAIIKTAGRDHHHPIGSIIRRGFKAGAYDLGHRIFGVIVIEIGIKDRRIVGEITHLGPCARQRIGQHHRQIPPARVNPHRIRCENTYFQTVRQCVHFLSLAGAVRQGPEFGRQAGSVSRIVTSRRAKEAICNTRAESLNAAPDATRMQP